MKPLDSLGLSQVNRRLKVIRQTVDQTRVRSGWIRYMRQALNMTLNDLAKRAGLSVSTVAQAERGEAAEKVTIATLKTMAQAMDCELIYAFVPKLDVDQVTQKAAYEKAKRLLESADTHMTLEDQRVQQSFDERVERLAKKLIEKGDVW